MKQHIFLVCSFICCTTHLFATIFTVSADPNHPAQFTTLNDAHNAASTDDTIQWYGSVYPGQLDMTKRLTIAGSPTIPDNQVPFIGLNSGAEGSSIISGRYSTIQGYFAPDQVCYVRNCIAGISGDISWNVTNCIISDVSGTTQSTAASSVFRNCLFLNYTTQANSDYIQVNIGNGGNLLFDHCVFNGALLLTGNTELAQIIFSNSIIKEIHPNSCFPSNTLFNNNLFILFSLDNTQFCGSQLLANNIMNAPIPFVNSSLVISPSMDFQLAPGSIGNDAASDGTDLGLHGGIDAWPVGYQYAQVAPGVPIVSSISLQNHVIGVADQLQMNAEGTIPSNE